MTAVSAPTSRSRLTYRRTLRPIEHELGRLGDEVINARKPDKKPVATSRTALSLLGPLFVISLAVPLYIYVGSVRLVPYRILLLAALIPLTLTWLTGKAGSIRLPDILMLFAATWGALALLLAPGSTGVETVVIFFIETFGAYLLARVTVRTYTDFFRMVQILFYLLVVLLPFAVIETLTNRALVTEFFSAVAASIPRGEADMRYGLHRASVVFDHPILYGTFCASAFALVYFVAAHRAGPIRRVLRAGIVSVATLCSISSGAIAAIALQVCLIAWHYATKSIRRRWRVLGILFAIGYLAVDLLSNRSPIEVFISYLTIDRETGYFRILIWNYGSAEVLRHPLFGIGMADWVRPNWMPASVDNFWLLTAMRYGLPALAFFAGSMVLMMVGVGRQKFDGPALNGARTGLLISLGGLMVAGCTVHYWNATYVWLVFLVGSGMWMLDAGDKPAGDAGSEEPDAGHPRQDAQRVARLRRS
jgi:hypothetical protein